LGLSPCPSFSTGFPKIMKNPNIFQPYVSNHK
jgi:hypothetical protein